MILKNISLDLTRGAYIKINSLRNSCLTRERVLIDSHCTYIYIYIARINYSIYFVILETLEF